MSATANDRDRAWETVCEFVKDQGLRRHMLAVGAAMRWYAEKLDEDPERWECAGLLHDFDWEIHPDLDRHPKAGAPILRERGWDEEMIRTILSHFPEGTGVKPTEPIDFALRACDEVTGLIVATALVRPSKDLREVKIKSVKKKWKSPAFAAGVDRQHVTEVAEDFSQQCFGGELELWIHVENVLDEISDTLVRGESVKISSFGSFSVRQKGERKGRNPKTGEEVPIKPRRVLVFRASNVLKQRINRSLNPSSENEASAGTL